MVTSIKKEYPNEFKNVRLEDVLTVYKDYKLVSDYNFVENWNKNKNVYLKNGNISQSLYNFIDDIVVHNDDFEVIISKLKILKNSEKLNSKGSNESSNDLKQLEIFESVLYSSKELWLGASNKSEFSRPNYCNQQIIVSDAATTLIFGASGPFSVFAGAISSLVTASSGDCVN